MQAVDMTRTFRCRHTELTSGTPLDPGSRGSGVMEALESHGGSVDGVAAGLHGGPITTTTRRCTGSFRHS